jgi:ethanolamine utilization protein EutN
MDMRIGKVIGSVTLSRWHPSLGGGRFPLATPLSLVQVEAAAAGQAIAGEAEPFVVYDEIGAGTGSLIAISEGGEAAQPFRPEVKPVDAYAAAILDRIHM